MPASSSSWLRTSLPFTQLTQSLTSMFRSSSALPFSVLVTLFYRVAVLYLATRIVLALKRQTGGYEDNRKLSEEEPARPLRSLTMRRRTDCAATAPQAARVMTIVLAYARSLLVAGSSIPLSIEAAYR